VQPAGTKSRAQKAACKKTAFPVGLPFASGKKGESMADDQPHQLVTPRNWSDVLGVMEAAAEKNIETARRRDESLASLGPAMLPPEDRPEAWQQHLQQCVHLHSDFQACYEAAQRGASELESVLAESEESLAGWLAAAESIRQKLVNWTAASV
jgi:hypothetical protein